MKTCSVCKEEKAIIDFYKNYAKCKKCCYETQKLYRKTEKGKAARQRECINQRLSEKKKIRQKKYRSSEKGKLSDRKHEEKRYSTIEGKKRLSAKNAVKYAVKVGKLIKEPCFICGDAKSVAHHSSYAEDMKLAVTWLCSKHHNEIHNPAQGESC